MKLITVLFLVLTQISFAQSDLDYNGFNEIRLGKSYEALKIHITEVDDAPTYAWFAPMTIEYYMNATGEDSSGYYEMLETDRLIAESLNTKIIWCTFKKQKVGSFFKFPIKCAQFVFVDDILIAITLTFDKDEMTENAKSTIVNQLELTLGDGLLNHNAGNLIPQFNRNWTLNTTKVAVSDASWDLGSGESLHLTFIKE